MYVCVWSVGRYKNRSVLAYHYYCWAIGSTTEPFKTWQRVLCDDVLGPLVLTTLVLCYDVSVLRNYCT